MVGSALIIGTLGLNYGIDFTGGSLTEVAYESVPDKAEVEKIVTEQGFDDMSVRESVDEAGRNAYLIRTRDLTEPERAQLDEVVSSLGEGGEVTRFTSIGPVIGEELRSKAGWAIFGVVLIIILYVAFAFAGI